MKKREEIRYIGTKREILREKKEAKRTEATSFSRLCTC
jgi:hypothetical protein